MEVFHVGDKVFLDDARDFEDYFEDFECDEIEYGTIEAINTENNLMTISPLINDKTDWWTTKIKVHMDSSHIHKIDFLPKEKVVIHDLLKDYWNKKGVVDLPYQLEADSGIFSLGGYGLKSPGRKRDKVIAAVNRDNLIHHPLDIFDCPRELPEQKVNIHRGATFKIRQRIYEQAAFENQVFRVAG